VKKGEEKEEEVEKRGDEKGPESGVGTKEGDEKKDAERRHISLYSPLSRIPPIVRVLCLFLLYYFTLCLLRFLSPFLPHPGPLPCFHNLSSI